MMKKEEVEKILTDFHVKDMMTLDEAVEEILRLFPPIVEPKTTKKVDLSEISDFIRTELGAESRTYYERGILRLILKKDDEVINFIIDSYITLDSFKQRLKDSIRRTLRPHTETSLYFLSKL